MRILSVFTFSIFLTITAPAFAQSAQQANLVGARSGGSNTTIAVPVHAGFSKNISFLNTDEHIVRAWLDDPSRYTLSFDQPLCSTENRNCQSGKPQVIHVRLVTGFTFPNLPTAPGNRTFLTVMTRDRQNQSHLYVFLLSPATGTPKFHTLILNPNQQSAPSITQNASKSTRLNLTKVSQGMAYAQSHKKLPDNPDLWERVNHFIAYVRQGSSYIDAAAKAGIGLQVIHKLEEWGSAN